MAPVQKGYNACEVKPPVLAKCPNCGFHPLGSFKDARSFVGTYQSWYRCKECSCSFTMRYFLPLTKNILLINNVDEYGVDKDALQHFGIALLADDTAEKMLGAGVTVKFDAVPGTPQVESLVVLPAGQYMPPDLQERTVNEAKREDFQRHAQHDSSANPDNQD